MDAWQGLAGPLVDTDEGLAEGTAGQQGSGLAAAVAAAAAAVGGGVEAEGGEVELEGVPLLQQRNQQQQQQRRQQHTPAAAFGVVTPVGGVTPSGSPRAAAAVGVGGSGGLAAGVSALLPRATAAWVNSLSNSGGNSPSRPSTPQQPLAAAGAAAGSSGSNGSNGASSSKAAAAGRCPSFICPCLVFVVEQQDCVSCMVQSPLLFDELDTLDLGGLGIGDEGAAGMAKTLSQNPNTRRCVLSDNKIGEEGGAALAAALAVNTSLQVTAEGGRRGIQGGFGGEIGEAIYMAPEGGVQAYKVPHSVGGRGCAGQSGQRVHSSTTSRRCALHAAACVILSMRCCWNGVVLSDAEQPLLAAKV